MRIKPFICVVLVVLLAAILSTGCTNMQTVNSICIDKATAAAIILQRQGYDAKIALGPSPHYNNIDHAQAVVMTKDGPMFVDCQIFITFGKDPLNLNQDYWFNPNRFITVEESLNTWYNKKP